MQAIEMYKAERKAVKASINRLHAEIWRQDQQPGTDVSRLRQEIGAHERRLRTIDYLIRWLKQKTE